MASFLVHPVSFVQLIEAFEWASTPGEVFFAPRECSAQGRLLIDGPIEYVGFPGEPVEVIIQKGKIMDIDTPDNVVNRFSRQLIQVKARDKYQLLLDLRSLEITGDVYPFGEYTHAILSENANLCCGADRLIPL